MVTRIIAYNEKGLSSKTYNDVLTEVYCWLVSLERAGGPVNIIKRIVHSILRGIISSLRYLPLKIISL